VKINKMALINIVNILLIMERKEKRSKNQVKRPQAKKLIRKKTSSLTLPRELPKSCLMTAEF
jgi:hypothetical protein